MEAGSSPPTATMAQFFLISRSSVSAAAASPKKTSAILMLAQEKTGLGEKVKRGLRYLYMGVLGSVLYYVILQVLLQIEGKSLDTTKDSSTTFFLLSGKFPLPALHRPAASTPPQKSSYS